jgi:hypothetical protein
MKLVNILNQQKFFNYLLKKKKSKFCFNSMLKLFVTKKRSNDFLSFYSLNSKVMTTQNFPLEAVHG